MINKSVLINHAAADLAIQPQILEIKLAKAVKQIKIAKIPKPNGYYRQLHIASRPAKLLQYWVMNNILYKLPIHSAAAAFYSGASILNNAKRHRHNNYFVRIDLHHFFPSLKAKDVCFALEYHRDYHLVNQLIEDINICKSFRQSLFISDDHLAIGFPISPVLSNIVMNRIDIKIDTFLQTNHNKFGSPVYSRYADDIVISIKKKGFANLLRDKVTDIVQNEDWPNLKVNTSKTKFGSRRSGSAQVTGLRITSDSRITLHRKYKDKIRLLTALASHGKLTPEEISQLRGHLNYARGVDPCFFGKLMTKYFDTLETILS